MVKIAAIYSSLVDAIVTDPELMAMPIHDHAIVRGHAVFDTCTVAGGRLYRVDIHLDRHIASAQKARIPLPFGRSPEECKDVAPLLSAPGARGVDAKKTIRS